MKINKYILLVFSVILAGMSACSDDFLEQKPYSSLNTGQTEAQVINAQVIGLHRTFAELWGYSDRQGFLGCWQIGTDVCSPGATEGVENPFYQYADLNSENVGVSYLWQKCYDFINNANVIIDAVGETNPAVSAEAKFFRAYAYNILVTFWSNVPLLTTAIKVPTLDFIRNPVADIDAVIDADLTYAVANLPEVEKAATPSRINKDMARQLAAECYLRIGMRDNSYFAKAEQMTTQIIDGGKYKLVEARYGKFMDEGGDYYRDMFRFGNERRKEGNTETIWTFEMEYERNVVGGTINAPQHRRVWQPAYHKWSGMVNADSLGGRGNGRLRLSNYMKYTVWQGLDGDIRNSNYNIRRYVNYNRAGYSEEIGIDAKGFRVEKASPAAVKTIVVKTGDRAVPYEADSLEVWYPYCTKWGGYDATDDFGWALIKDWQIMRLGETYLLRAEARFRQNKNAEAAADINVLRDRAFKTARETSGNTTLGQVSSDQINIDFILAERARELIGEENRRMTLIRTGQLANHVSMNGDAVPGAPSNKVITGFDASKHILLPVPLREIQLNNGAVLEQNTGY
ncbi:MAG: RagB/SusD family nutrient uptake outer membrane protein [Dysgonamonadaceae bacterium]|jgi:hypothetical protein|nr:RagB/SusD family nutrient uptake outer membrane protein [Dysgonamonadaceae bacterium]